ncbi:hypothetical protein PVAP13_6KG383512 [Panicum virgatum]|uniref:Uncharacterized protein n=1 Tax=Panicum virgatum TaxID=38727 RepID=A0A8T0RH69_PANVG|nr:hypothetical protein PVAP13_6KG383512 [Panicum virgatum]
MEFFFSSLVNDMHHAPLLSILLKKLHATFLLLFLGWVPPLPRNCILPPLSFLIKKLMLTLLSAQKFYM